MKRVNAARDELTSQAFGWMIAVPFSARFEYRSPAVRHAVCNSSDGRQSKPALAADTLTPSIMWLVNPRVKAACFFASVFGLLPSGRLSVASYR